MKEERVNHRDVEINQRMVDVKTIDDARFVMGICEGAHILHVTSPNGQTSKYVRTKAHGDFHIWAYQEAEQMVFVENQKVQTGEPKPDKKTGADQRNWLLVEYIAKQAPAGTRKMRLNWICDEYKELDSRGISPTTPKVKQIEKKYRPE